MNREELIQNMAKQMHDVMAKEMNIDLTKHPFEKLPEWAIKNLSNYSISFLPIFSEFIDSIENPYKAQAKHDVSYYGKSDSKANNKKLGFIKAIKTIKQALEK